jgi:16S rRNA (cytidine1402-2'-O)-methyltransferase
MQLNTNLIDPGFYGSFRFGNFGKNMETTLYLIPTTLGEEEVSSNIPRRVFESIRHVRHFIVESERSARRFLARAGLDTKIQDVLLEVLDEHSNVSDTSRLIDWVEEHNQVGILSDAGLPGVADPGCAVVRLAHSRGFRVIPLPGPGSIYLALMASGLNGQNFAFNGYLPVKNPDRSRKLKSLESRSRIENQSQIFMETPYRNMSLLEDALESLAPETLLCIAANLTQPDEFIHTRKINQWKGQLPDLKKKPAIFILQA